MTEDERRMVIQLLRDAGLVIVSSSLLADGTMTCESSASRSPGRNGGAPAQ
jgi:hypothetical protein